MVRREIKTDSRMKVSCEEVALAIRILLGAKSTVPEESAQRRVLKGQRKQMHRFLRLPHEFLDTMNQTENVSKLMHNVKQEYLMNFLQKDANCFLLTYFFKNDGINETDPMNQRPDCTKRALDIISELANDLI